MVRDDRFLRLGWIRGAVVLAALHGARALAQDAQTGAVPVPPRVQAPAALPAAAAALAVPVGQAMELDDLLEANRQQYRALMISELSFCRVACDLTKEQTERMARRAGVIIEEAAARTAAIELKIARRGGIRLAAGPVPPNPVKVVRDGLERLVNDHGTPAQQSRYQAEMTKRAAYRRQTAIGSLVARMDQMLILTGAQRDRLVQVFESNWKDKWGATMSVMGDDEAPLPAIPDRLIVPILSATQQRVWKRMDKQAIDATAAYVGYVSEIMEGLPSEFTECLDAAERGAAKRAGDLKKDNSDQGSH